MSILMLLCLLVPVISGLALKCVKNDIKDKRKIFILSLLLECVLVIITILDEPQGFCLFAMTDTLKVYLKIDGLSKLFMLIASFGFLIAGVFASKYMVASLEGLRRGLADGKLQLLLLHELRAQEGAGN